MRGANSERAAKYAADLYEIERRVIAAGAAGATLADIDIGQRVKTAEAARSRLQKSGRIFGLRIWQPGETYADGTWLFRYFSSEQLRDAAKVGPKHAPRAEIARHAKAEAQRQRRAEKKAGIVRPKRHRSPPKPQAHQALTIKKRAETEQKVTASEAWRAAPADYSRAVITRIPTPAPRFAPEPGFVRQITNDWRESRLQGLT